MHMTVIHTPGTRSGRLTVVRYIGKRAGYHIYLLRCDCGKEMEQRWRPQDRQSCGCLRAEKCKTHNHAKRYEPGEANFNRLLGQYKNGALRRGLSFELTEEQFKILTKSDCAYCGAVPSMVGGFNKASFGTYIYNGIDRVDNKLGYTVANSVACCNMCNLAKRTSSQAEFLAWVSRVYKNSTKKGLI